MMFVRHNDSVPEQDRDSGAQSPHNNGDRKLVFPMACLAVLAVVAGLSASADETPSATPPAAPVELPKAKEADAGTRNTRLEELQQQAAAAERESIELASKFRDRLKQADIDQKTKDAVQAELREVVKKAFQVRQEYQQLEVELLQQQVQAMNQKLSVRRDNAEQIIARRIDDLLNPAKQWEDTTPAATPRPMTWKSPSNPFFGRAKPTDWVDPVTGTPPSASIKEMPAGRSRVLDGVSPKSTPTVVPPVTAR